MIAFSQVPVLKDLVLIGGGHSHVAVLKRFGMQPLPGLRLTLISSDTVTPYSGMLPGLIAGHYTFDQAHLELRPLCRFAGAQFYQATVAGLDLANKQVLCQDRPPVGFDLLSIDTGSTPKPLDLPGSAKHVLPVKPVGRFLCEWERLQSILAAARTGTFRIAVVGGGAGGVELTLAAQHRLNLALAAAGRPPDSVQFHLVTDSPVVLPTHNRRVQAKFARILRQRGIQLHLNQRAAEVQPGLIRCQSGHSIPCDAVFWVTTAAAPSWPAAAGLKTDPGGFIAVNDRLQSLSHPFVFAAGDVAAVVNYPRPKSGVFAVRQGRPLAGNLRRHLTGQSLKPFAPQKQFLSLISTGDAFAVASRGSLAFEGAWVWRWKNWIDRRWMRQYQELPRLGEGGGPAPASALAAGNGTELMETPAAPAPRCGGCGAKVGGAILASVLRRVRTISRSDVLLGLESPDDAAVTVVPAGKVSVQTVDFFRDFVSDPFLFGRIAANHCLGDIFAMGASPQSALAIVTVPFGAAGRVEETLFQVISGAAAVLADHETTLAGGHTAEGPELAFGLAVHGLADPDRLLRKKGMQPGDRLILTKPLGTGTLLAAEMRGQAKGRWIQRAIEVMLLSNREAAQCFLRHRAGACTDVTGFGLVGHLAEMTKASGVAADLELNAIPLLEGAETTFQAGILSSLQPQNLRARRALSNPDEAARHPRYPILFDPQTAGGLLASVPAASADVCVEELRRLGCGAAAIVGEVQPLSANAAPIRIRL